MAEERQGGRSSGERRRGGWILWVVAGTRFFVVLPVLGTFLSAVALYAYGTLAVVRVLWDAVARREVSVGGAQHLQVAFVELADVFLLGTVLVVVALGLCQLFIQPDLPVPAWLRIRSLDQLSSRLIEVVSALLAVTFLAFAGGVGAGADVLEFGLAVAAVIGALSLLLVVSRRGGGDDPQGAD